MNNVRPAFLNAILLSEDDAVCVVKAAMANAVNLVPSRWQRTTQEPPDVRSGEIYVLANGDSERFLVKDIVWSNSRRKRSTGEFTMYREKDQDAMFLHKSSSPAVRAQLNHAANHGLSAADEGRFLGGCATPNTASGEVFKVGGLVKKTIKVVTTTNHSYQVVAFYSLNDAASTAAGRLNRPVHPSVTPQTLYQGISKVGKLIIPSTQAIPASAPSILSALSAPTAKSSAFSASFQPTISIYQPPIPAPAQPYVAIMYSYNYFTRSAYICDPRSGRVVSSFDRLRSRIQRDCVDFRRVGNPIGLIDWRLLAWSYIGEVRDARIRASLGEGLEAAGLTMNPLPNEK